MDGLIHILGFFLVEHAATTLPILLLLVCAWQLERIRRQLRIATWLLAGAKVKPVPDEPRQ